MDDSIAATDYLAARLRVFPDTIRRWARAGWKGPSGEPLPGVTDLRRPPRGDYRYVVAPEIQRRDVAVLTVPEAERRFKRKIRAIYRAFAEGALPEVVAIYRFPRAVRVLVRGTAMAILPANDPKQVDWSRQPLGKVSDRELARRLRVSATAVATHRRKLGLPACGRPGRPSSK